LVGKNRKNYSLEMEQKLALAQAKMEDQDMLPSAAVVSSIDTNGNWGIF